MRSCYYLRCAAQIFGSLEMFSQTGLSASLVKETLISAVIQFRVPLETGRHRWRPRQIFLISPQISNSTAGRINKNLLAAWGRCFDAEVSVCRLVPEESILGIVDGHWPRCNRQTWWLNYWRKSTCGYHLGFEKSSKSSNMILRYKENKK
jgi:hypothetical protein